MAVWHLVLPLRKLPNGARFTCAAQRSGAASGASAGWAALSIANANNLYFSQDIPSFGRIPNTFVGKADGVTRVTA